MNIECKQNTDRRRRTATRSEAAKFGKSGISNTELWCRSVNIKKVAECKAAMLVINGKIGVWMTLELSTKKKSGPKMYRRLKKQSNKILKFTLKCFITLYFVDSPKNEVFLSQSGSKHGIASRLVKKNSISGSPFVLRFPRWTCVDSCKSIHECVKNNNVDISTQRTRWTCEGVACATYEPLSSSSWAQSDSQLVMNTIVLAKPGALSLKVGRIECRFRSRPGNVFKHVNFLVVVRNTWLMHKKEALQLMNTTFSTTEFMLSEYQLNSSAGEIAFVRRRVIQFCTLLEF